MRVLGMQNQVGTYHPVGIVRGYILTEATCRNALPLTCTWDLGNGRNDESKEKDWLALLVVLVMEHILVTGKMYLNHVSTFSANLNLGLTETKVSYWPYWLSCYR